MIVNLYVDHLMSAPPASAEEVWNATREHAHLFDQAAHRIGLTPAEYREFRANLLDGKAAFVKLPRRLDAMSGNRRGTVYAVKNAVLSSTVMGWRVNLADGNVVYVPQACGNISLLRNGAVARVAHAPVHAPYTQAVASIPKTVAETPVSMVPPATPEVPVEAAAAAPVIAAAAPVAAAAHPGAFLFLIPAAIGGIIAGIGHGGQSHPAAPPCSGGSNVGGVCSK